MERTEPNLPVAPDRAGRLARQIHRAYAALILCLLASIGFVTLVARDSATAPINVSCFTIGFGGGQFMLMKRSPSFSQSPKLVIVGIDTSDPWIENFQEIQQWWNALPRSESGFLGIKSVRIFLNSPTEQFWVADEVRRLLIPLEYPAILLAIIVALLFRRVMRLRRQRNSECQLCPNCGYDLRASPERCPECGTPRAGIAVV